MTKAEEQLLEKKTPEIKNVFKQLKDDSIQTLTLHRNTACLPNSTFAEKIKTNLIQKLNSQKKIESNDCEAEAGNETEN